MKSLYICHTIYHVLISCIKALLKSDCIDILLVDTIPNVYELKHRLISAGIFNDIYILSHGNIFNKYTKNSFHLNYIYILYNKNKINEYLKYIKLYDYIYIYNDYSNVGAYLIINKIKYHLIEDGYNLFKNFNVHKDCLKMKPFKMLLYKIFNIPYQIGLSKYIIDIEVNDILDLKTPLCNKIIQRSRKEMMNKLSETSVNIITDIFELSVNVAEDRKSLLLLTQPLIEIGIVSSLRNQLAYYKCILEKYVDDYDIYIKPHPRDSANYKDLFQNKQVHILNKYSPIEILDMKCRIQFDIGVTYSSTAITSLSCCKNKIQILKN